MSVGDILNRTPSSVLNGNIGSNVKKLTKDLRTSTAGVLDNSRFSSRAELEKSGLDRQYDALQARLARGEVYKTTVSTANLKLSAKQTALTDIRAVMTKFKGDTSSPEKATGSRQELADKALAEIGIILNRQDSGKYIFGGKTDNAQPVQGDITKLDEKNFTHVEEGMMLVDISDTKSIDVNMITARDVAPFIAALNLYKHGDATTNSATEFALTNAITHHEYLHVKIDEALKTVDGAAIENVVNISNAQETLDNDFTVNIVDRAEKMYSATQSLLMNFKIAAGTRSLLEKIMFSS